jgi:hypothetical protein
MIAHFRFFDFSVVLLLSSPTNARHIRSVLDTILQGCVSPPDFSIHRACFQLLRNLVLIWRGQGVIAGDAALQEFIRVKVTTQLFKSICSPHFDLKDAQCICAVRDLLELQKTIYLSLGEEYLNYLHTDCLQGMLGFPAEVGKEYCVVLMNYNSNNNQNGSEWKQFEGFFRALQAKSAPPTPTAASFQPQQR